MQYKLFSFVLSLFFFGEMSFAATLEPFQNISTSWIPLLGIGIGVGVSSVFLRKTYTDLKRKLEHRKEILKESYQKKQELESQKEFLTRFIAALDTIKQYQPNVYQEEKIAQFLQKVFAFSRHLKKTISTFFDLIESLFPLSKKDQEAIMYLSKFQDLKRISSDDIAKVQGEAKLFFEEKLPFWTEKTTDLILVFDSYLQETNDSINAQTNVMHQTKAKLFVLFSIPIIAYLLPKATRVIQRFFKK